MLYLLYLIGLTILILIYFQVAVKYNIVDAPNYRSSHKKLTIRGGGILFPIAVLIPALTAGIEYPHFTIGLFLIGLISFYDDIQPVSNKIRILIHLISVSLMFWELGFSEFPILMVIMAYIVVIGTINAYNFMDGINGITGGYSLVALVTLYYINETETVFVQSSWIIAPTIAVLVFNFFNFRKQAKCFAGDVGSVSMAFILTFFLLLLIIKTEEVKFIGLLLIYGLDSITTIIFRAMRKENIFEAHRSHFYQYLANNLHWSHLSISAIYLFIQLVFNAILLKLNFDWIELILFFLVSGLLFIGMRFWVEGKEHLLGTV